MNILLQYENEEPVQTYILKGDYDEELCAPLSNLQFNKFKVLASTDKTPQLRIIYNKKSAQLSKDECTKLDENLNLLRKFK